MSIFDKETEKKVENMNKVWIKSSEFDGNGLVLRVDSVSKVSGDYGASAESSIVKRGILEEGQSFRYVFTDPEGVERKHDSASFPLFIGMEYADVSIGDWVHIKRGGKGEETKYAVVLTEKPKPIKKAPKKDDEEGLDSSKIPF